MLTHGKMHRMMTLGLLSVTNLTKLILHVVHSSATGRLDSALDSSGFTKRWFAVQVMETVVVLQREPTPQRLRGRMREFGDLEENSLSSLLLNFHDYKNQPLILKAWLETTSSRVLTVVTNSIFLLTAIKLLLQLILAHVLIQIRM